ncbi:MAG: type II toxin-antitoxin system HicB family antitoxin [Treponema sp.]|nr:type II toxin-antitoxin system HicB family antitoxin [Treponema sp.]
MTVFGYCLTTFNPWCYDEVIDSWAAYCPEMPGINSCGATQEEAATNFKEAAELFFEPSDFLVPEKSKVLQIVL